MKLTGKIAAFEFSGDEVRLALVKTGAALPTVLALHVCRAEYAAPGERFEAMVAAVKTVAAKVRKPSAYILCASSRFAVARALRLAFRGARRVASAVPFELEPYLAVPLDELVVDFTTIREIDGETEVLAVGVRRTEIMEQLKILRAADIEPESIGLDAAALTSLWHAGQRRSNGLRAVLHIRNESAVLGIVYGKSLAYFRHLPFDLSRFEEDPAGAARQVENSIRGFQATWKGDGEIEEISVIGAPSTSTALPLFEDGVSAPVIFGDVLDRLKGARRCVSEAAIEYSVSLAASSARRPLPAPVETSRPSEISEAVDERDPAAEEDLAQVETAVSSVAEQPSEYSPEVKPEMGGAYWEAVIGAANAAAGGTYAFEFLRGEFEPASLGRSLLRRAVFSSALAMLVLLMACGYAYVTYAQEKKEIDLIGQQIWQVYTDTVPEASRGLQARPAMDIAGTLTFDQLGKDVEKMPQGKTLPNPEIFSKPTVLDVLMVLSEAMPEGKVLLTNLRMTGGRDSRVVISGEIQDQSAFDQMMEKLRSSSVMTIDEEPNKSFKEGSSTFTLNAKR